MNFRKTLLNTANTILAIFVLTLWPLNIAFGSAEDECTLAGACGYFAKGGGSIVLKNRDRNTRFIQSIDFVRPAGGHAFIGVKNRSADPETFMDYTMGINEKGFICVSSSPPSKINFNFHGRKYKVYHPGFILSQISTVDEFIEKILKAGKLKSAMNYIAADSQKMCLVESIDEKHYDYKIIINGTLVQTNHYHFNKMLIYQGQPVNASSAARLKRVSELLSSYLRPLGPEDFMDIARDHGENETYDDLNICRHPDSDYASTKFDGGTISSMVLISRKNEPPCAYIAIGQPCLTPYKKFIIDGGACEMNIIEKTLYSSGAINIINDLARDAYYHFIKVFIKKTSAGSVSGHGERSVKINFNDKKHGRL